MAALFFDGLRNAKFNAITTEISNQALHGKDVMTRTYDEVLKLASSWENKSTSKPWKRPRKKRSTKASI